MKRTDKHIFVVCAYGASPYLDACVQSLTAQTLRSRILICTSTPNDTIAAVCEKYGLELRVNHGERGITGDWNFAMSQADAPFVTIAHQDDLYEPTYTEAVMDRAMRAKRPILLPLITIFSSGIRSSSVQMPMRTASRSEPFF